MTGTNLWQQMTLALAVLAAGMACGGQAATGAGGDPPEADPNASTGSEGNVTLGGQGNQVAVAAGNVQLFGSGFAAYEGKNVYASIFTTGGRVAGKATVAVAQGAFHLPFLLPVSAGYGQQAVYVIDADGNGVCNVGTADVGGNQRIPASGVVTVTPDAGQRPLCEALGTWTLRLSGSDFAPANGRWIVAAVRDVQDNAYILGPTRAAVVGGTWGLSFAAPLVAGHAYEVRAFLDDKGDGSCQNEGWSVATGTVSADVDLKLSYGAARTAVCADFPAP